MTKDEQSKIIDKWLNNAWANQHGSLGSLYDVFKYAFENGIMCGLELAESVIQKGSVKE